MSFCKTFEIIDRMNLLKQMDRIEHPPPVLTKRDFVERYAKGEFGNASPTWQTCNELLAHGQTIPANHPQSDLGLFHLRNRQAGGSTYYNLSWSACVAKWIEQERQSDWYASAMAPSACTILQGELQDRPEGLYLNYNQVAAPMREAFALQSRHSCGIMTRCLLKQHMDPTSYDWVQVLLERYPEHVIEFSCYSKFWGTIPFRNTVIWEVRRY